MDDDTGCTTGWDGLEGMFHQIWSSVKDSLVWTHNTTYPKQWESLMEKPPRTINPFGLAIVPQGVYGMGVSNYLFSTVTAYQLY